MTHDEAWRLVELWRSLPEEEREQHFEVIKIREAARRATARIAREIGDDVEALELVAQLTTVLARRRIGLLKKVGQKPNEPAVADGIIDDAPSDNDLDLRRSVARRSVRSGHQRRRA